MKKVFLTIRQSKWLGLLTQISPTIKLFVALLLLACGPSPADYGEFFSLFYPESATFPAATKPYFYSPLLLNGDTDYLQISEPSQEESLEMKENLTAWHSFLRGSIEKPVIKEGIYGKHRSNAFAKTIGHSFPEAARYLALSLEIESKTPFYQYSWEKPDAIDTIRLAALQQEAKALMLQSQEPFLKERYLFQYTKLCAVNGNNNQILKEYTTLEKTIKEKTFITDWSRSRLAGAKIALGDTAEAIFDFAQIFNNCPSRRTQADLSVRRLPAHYFEKAQKYCKTKDQKANLYALTAIQPFRDGLELAENIYEINPSHPMLELGDSQRNKQKRKAVFCRKKQPNVCQYGCLPRRKLPT
jgi:hypothetical protein